ncbi:MAG: DUF5606 domain-containing protein [Bacteroidales bacterium]|nr:DUF5606 domain-containing protein [Bacteroidales bacterium]MDD3859828.1 DUF5606 domain-containing protein [Bacteroidales bacterium]
MFLDGILAIAGQQGLYKLVSKGKNNVIVESLTTGKRMPAFSTSRISTLEDVAIYTYDEDVALREVFIKVFEKHQGQQVLSTKATNKELLDFLTEILPDYDKDRVYVSDIKKLVNWYNTLIEKNILHKDNIKAEEKVPEAEKTEPETEETVKTEK